MKPGNYYDAVAWIAANDNPGDDEPIEALAGYISVVLVADLFDVPSKEVAAGVWRLRRAEVRP